MANTQRKRKTFKEKEVVHVIPVGNDKEFRFTVVEIDGELAGDMRFWDKGRKEDIMLPSKRGIPFPVDPDEFLKGFGKLREKLQAA